MSPRRQPRSAGTRRISTHQNTKKVKLLSTMNTTWTTKAPRSATVALRLVASRARAKAKLFDGRVIQALAPIDGQRGCGPPKHPAHDDRRRTGPDHEVAGERAGRDAPVLQHERRGPCQDDRKRRECCGPLDECRVQLEWQHETTKDEQQFLPDPVHG